MKSLACVLSIFWHLSENIMNSALELLYLIIFSGLLAVASYLLSGQILSSNDGNEKMKEIAKQFK